MKISLIAAVAKNNVIGDGKTLLWHIPGDLPRFKEITMGHHILMGRKTFESIGRVLPGRTNLIISSDTNLQIPGAFVFDSPEKAVEFANKNREKELMIIGGGEIYKYFLPLSNKIYLTKILKDYKGSTVFPEFSEAEWQKKVIEVNSENDPAFEVIELNRIAK